MNPSRRAQNVRHARECVEAVRDYPDDEVRAAAAFLGLSGCLPDAQPQLPLIAPSERTEGQQGVKDDA